MKVGDLVEHFLTEQVGIVTKYGRNGVQILWTTKGLSMWIGNKTWETAESLEVISESR